MPEIMNVHDYVGGLDSAIAYIHHQWGNAANYTFYEDAIRHSSQTPSGLPRFYVMVQERKIIGCYGLIINDFISRHDLFPWLACLFVESDQRGHQYGKCLLEHGVAEAKRCGFAQIYLTTDHDQYYEQYGWQRMEDGFEPSGERTRIYTKNTNL